jgi:hypothetical protein
VEVVVTKTKKGKSPRLGVSKVMSKSTDRSSYIRYLPCQAVPGVFKDELMVTVRAVDPQALEQEIQVQSFVDANEVILTERPAADHPSEGWLRVALMQAKGTYAQVVLPQPSWPIGPVLLVKKALMKKKEDLQAQGVQP